MAHFFAQKTFSILLALIGVLLLVLAVLSQSAYMRSKNLHKKHLFSLFLALGAMFLFCGIVQTVSTYSTNLLLNLFFISAVLGFYVYYGFPYALKAQKKTSAERVQRQCVACHLCSMMIFVFSGITLLSLLMEIALPQTQEFTGVTENIVWIQSENAYTAHFDETHSVTISLVPQEVCTEANTYYKSQRGYFTSLGFSSRLLEAETREPHRLVQWLQSFTQYFKDRLTADDDSYTASVYFLETGGLRSTLDFYYVTVIVDKDKNVTSLSIADDSMLKNHIRTASLPSVANKSNGNFAF